MNRPDGAWSASKALGNQVYAASPKGASDTRCPFGQRKIAGLPSRNDEDNGWVTLDDVDYVVAVTVDEKDNPKKGLVFMIDGDEMRERFNRTYRARLDAGHTIPVGRGVWVSMFVEEDLAAPSTVGGGIALNRKPLASVLLGDDDLDEPADQPDEAPMTIAEAKRRLAQSLGVDPEKIKILIEA